jgi:hypothetical protein
VTDERLAILARNGDEHAFRTLANRYHRVMRAATRGRHYGMGWEDEPQEALIGLHDACRAYTPNRGRFGPFAATCIRNRILKARTRGACGAHRILNEAAPLEPATDGSDWGERREPDRIAYQLARPELDPAMIVELREDLARLARDGDRRRERATPRPPRRCPSRTRYGTEQKQAALRLVKTGRTTREAAAAVGAAHTTVMRWHRATRRDERIAA